jgi:hypothetical protein
VVIVQNKKHLKHLTGVGVLFILYLCGRIINDRLKSKHYEQHSENLNYGRHPAGVTM